MTKITATATTSVDRFLSAVEAGAGIPADLYAPDAVLDATVPNWRFSVRGGNAIAAQFAGWFAFPARFDELTRLPTEHGEVVTYLYSWEKDGVRHAAHHCHVFTIDAEGRIIRDEVWCGGQWDAALLARMRGIGDAR